MRPFCLYAALSDAALAAYRQHTENERPSVRLNVLSARDDKPLVVDTARKLDAPELTPDAFHRALLAQDRLTRDPNVVVVCGNASGPIELQGFPCWAIRLTDLRYVAWLTQHTPLVPLARPLDRSTVS